eukprot:9500615-Pyramimonas_sp.AAC.1
MSMGDSNRACDWLRGRVLANVEMRRLERSRRNLKNETIRHDLVVCATCKAGRCKNGEQCNLLRAGSGNRPTPRPRGRASQADADARERRSPAGRGAQRPPKDGGA